MLELVVAGASVVAVIAASTIDAHGRRRATRALERYARRRGHGFATGTRQSGPRVSVKRRDFELTIDFCRIGGELRTRVRARAPSGRAPLVSIAQRPHTIEAGGAERGLLELYRICAMPPLEVSTVVADCTETLTALSRRSGVWLASDGARVSLTWRGIEEDVAMIDAAVDAVAAAASWHTPRAPYR